MINVKKSIIKYEVGTLVLVKYVTNQLVGIITECCQDSFGKYSVVFFDSAHALTGSCQYQFGKSCHIYGHDLIPIRRENINMEIEDIAN